MQNNNTTLKVNKRLYRLSVPSTKAQLHSLEINLQKDKSQKYIYVWDNIILTDFDAYNICIKNHIKFEIIEMRFKSIHEAILWICCRNLKNNTLSANHRIYLIGESCKAKREMRNADYFRSLHNKKEVLKSKNSDTDIYEFLSREYKISPSSVKIYYRWAESMDKIFDISEEFASMILREEFKISQENLIFFSSQPKHKIQEVLKQILSSGTSKNFNDYKFLLTEKKKTVSSKTFDIQVKTMPEHDPDASIMSLIFTIPSWTSSLERICTSTDFNTASDKAKQSLLQKLKVLTNSIEKVTNILERK